MVDSLNDKYEEPAVSIKLIHTDEGMMKEEYSFDGYELYDALKNAYREEYHQITFDEYLENLQNS